MDKSKIKETPKVQPIKPESFWNRMLEAKKRSKRKATQRRVKQKALRGK